MLQVILLARCADCVIQCICSFSVLITDSTAGTPVSSNYVSSCSDILQDQTLKYTITTGMSLN